MAKLTKRIVEALKQDAIAWDVPDDREAGCVSGFGVRRQSGAPHYFLKYRVNGRQRWMTIGKHGSPWTVDGARQRARALLGHVAEDEDPAATRDWQGQIPTLAEFSADYIKDVAEKDKAPRSVVEDKRNLKKHILPALGQLRIDMVTTRDVVKFHSARRGAPVNANRCLALISTMMRTAEQWGLRPQHSNPCRDVTRNKETPRERFLSAEELARLGTALQELEKTEAHSPFALAALRVLAFTGARKSEIVTLRWEHVDLARGVARRDAKAGPRTIQLPPPALAVLKALSRAEDSPWVFPGSRDVKRHIGDIETVWRKVRAAAKLEGVHLHDLRHGFASVVATSGDSLVVIGAMLGHRNPQTTMRYAHLSTDPLAAAAAATAKKIEAAMGAKPAKKNLRRMAGR